MPAPSIISTTLRSGDRVRRITAFGHGEPLLGRKLDGPVLKIDQKVPLDDVEELVLLICLCQ